MESKLSIVDYVAAEGLELTWQPGYRIVVSLSDGEATVRANRAGLISLAAHLLTLAQDAVPSGEHIHLDDSNSLDEGSTGLVLEKE